MAFEKEQFFFYEELYKSEHLHDKADNVFLENLPQLSEEANGELGKALTLEELEKALQSMECGKAPGLDGLSVNFISLFGRRWVRTYWRCLRKAWPAGGYPQVAVEQFSSCCRKKET